MIKGGIVTMQKLGSVVVCLAVMLNQAWTKAWLATHANA